MDRNSHRLVKKSWGSELWIVNKPAYCGKILTLEGGKACSIHRHVEKDETFLVFDGKLCMETWQYGAKGKTLGKPSRFVMRKGDCFHILPNLWHRFTGITEKTTIIEFSTQHKDEDVVRFQVLEKEK